MQDTLAIRFIPHIPIIQLSTKKNSSIMYTPFSLIKQWSSPFANSPQPIFVSPELSYESFDGKRAVFTTSKSIEEVNEAVHATIATFPGHMRDVVAQTQTREAFQAHVEEAVKNTEKPSGMFLFFEMPHYDWYQLFKPDTPKSYKYIIGNPLALKEVAMYDLDSTLYGPWSFLVVEMPGKGTKVLFDLPTSVMKTKKGNVGLDQAAQELEEKFKVLVRSWL